MNAHAPRNQSSWLVIVLALSAVIAALLVAQFVPDASAAGGDSPSVTYSHGVLRASIPFRTGGGHMTMEVISPEDEVIARAERDVNSDSAIGTWREDLKLAKELPVEDLVWYRLRYRLGAGAGDGGTFSISQILRQPVLRILGQQSYLSGGQAAVRVIVTDANNLAVTGRSDLRIDLAAPGGKAARTLFTGPLNQRGTAEAQFRLPAGPVGNFPLHYVVDTPIGSAEFTQPVRIDNKAAILLTTEKPIYQPGQTIHVRALALDRANHEAAASRKLTFEVEDSRGNKVFKKATQTDKFGVASAEFALADEVNLGTYHLRALMDDNNAELALNVERYVLPKFKVAVEMGGGTKHGYRPGDHVTGTVRANYFFGKPVDGAEITVKASGMDVAVFEVGSVAGKTDRDGAWKFDLTLPAYFAGRPLSQGAARVLVEATVKDTAGHSETKGEPITVSQSPLIVTAVPEGGTLIPGLENQVFLLTSYADGKPAVAEVKIHAPGNADQAVTTDEGGVAVVRVRNATTLQVDASDKEGNRVSTAVPLAARGGTEQILLRTERVVYRAGERMALRVFSTKQRGTAYIDIVREGQTVLTRDVDIVNGQAELSVTATPELAGTLDCNAYLFGRDALPVADHRLIFVEPAGELKIEATTNAAAYKPGEDARIQFHVTNGKGEGVQAALGLQVVDEAVFALAEKQPGFAKVFFYLEQEAMKPRYEIHSLGMPEVVQPVEQVRGAQRDRAARALFAATEMVSRNKFETVIGRTPPQTKYAEYTLRYQKRFLAQLQQELPRAWRQNADLTKATLADAWGTALKIEPLRWSGQQTYLVRSAGPDKQLNTADDIGEPVQVQTGKVAGPPTSSNVAVEIEHDRGPFNGLAEISGTVLDQTGAAVAGATVKAREAGSGKERTARVGDKGQFQVAAVPAGDYDVQISSPGFQSPSRRVTLGVRDRALLRATLQVGSMTESVTVNVVAVGPRFRALGGGGGGVDVGGIAGGMPGGVIGGIFDGPVNGRRDVEVRQFGMQGQMGAQNVMAPAAAPMALMEMDRKAVLIDGVAKKDLGAAAPRVRSYFPEALYINPEIITDAQGRASISIPLADSITTWRMAMLASTPRGALGSATGSLKVFQDFFVDLDLPVTLTQGDRVTLPVAVYNYSGGRGDVSLQLKPADWFSLVSDASDKNVGVESNRVGGAQYTIEASRIGKFQLTLSARMAGSNRADIVVREIEVIPNGREQTQVFNGRLEGSLRQDVSFPAASIPDASKILVRLYPGPLSQVIEGMDAILRMPFGCFEQTSSATYPNVLALDYMKRTKKLTPEVHAKAEGFIANGYQRLLTFEVPGGGFSWFGQAPANKILTSYGLMEFSDMSKVHDVDPKLIERTQQWLAGQQQADGSWKPDTQFINEGATNRYNSDVLRITAYIGWALENTGYQGPAVEKARQFAVGHLNGKPDAYTLAVLANFAVDGKDRDFTRQAMKLLLDARTEKDEQAWWTAEETAVYGRGESASVETTGLAVQALLKWGQASQAAAKALRYIAAKKDAAGTWGTTQATIMALRALLLSTEMGAADVRGTVEISMNGKAMEKLVLTPENNDLLHQFVFKTGGKQANTVEVRFDGKGGLAYQVVGRYFIPWNEKPQSEALSIDVTYDRTRLAQNDIATATATIKNNLPKAANMVMVDLGIPPGFDLLSEDLQSFQEKSAALKTGRLEKFNQTATQAILYFNAFAPGETVKLNFRLRAKYPIRAKTLQSRVYEYYDPAVSSLARPVQLEVR